MPSTLLHRLCVGRAAQTGETPEQARAALLRLEPGTPPIPDAASEDQAFLESLFLEKLGRCRLHGWWSPSVPFMVSSVTPLPDELTVRVPAVFLPDLIFDIMPRWAVEDGDQDAAEVSGIAGLRALHERGRIVLARPGFRGRIVIPVRPNMWRKVCDVAIDLHGSPDRVHMPWQASPTKCHPVEIRYMESHPSRYSPDSLRHGSQFASRLMRRLPGLCPPPHAIYHDLWFNRIGRECSIQFEWKDGPSHADVLKRLLDPVFSPGAEIDLFDGETVADTYSRTQGYVIVRSSSQPTTDVVLRRLVSADKNRVDMRKFDAELRADRAAIEDKHGYRVPRRPKPVSRWPR
jgi:hypothetical protein